MTATFATGTDYSHYHYSGYSCDGRRPRQARPLADDAPAAFDVRLPRHLTQPAGRRAVRAADRASVAVIHVRRRVVAALAFTGTMLLLWLGAGTVLANRGDDPASVSSVRPGATHIAQPGESLWLIAEQYRGSADIVVYLEQLIDLNGGEAGIEVGQAVLLP